MSSTPWKRAPSLWFTFICTFEVLPTECTVLAQGLHPTPAFRIKEAFADHPLLFKLLQFSIWGFTVSSVPPSNIYSFLKHLSQSDISCMDKKKEKRKKNCWVCLARGLQWTFHVKLSRLLSIQNSSAVDKAVKVVHSAKTEWQSELAHIFCVHLFMNTGVLFCMLLERDAACWNTSRPLGRHSWKLKKRLSWGRLIKK